MFRLQNFECETCRISFVEKSSYHRHNLLVHCEKINFENSFDCMHCDKRFTTESSLDDHLEKFHSASLPKVIFIPSRFISTSFSVKKLTAFINRSTFCFRIWIIRVQFVVACFIKKMH